MGSEVFKNANRFTGFANTYNNARPSMPLYPVKTICKYLMNNPNTVVDLGCGTGLSTTVWESVCNNVIGIEPGLDMLDVANTKKSQKTSFVNAFSNNTGLANTSVDVVVCSQSFHWMEPVSTLKECNRILKKGGVFATVDYDWPPVTNWKIEKEYSSLLKKIRMLENKSLEIKNTFVRYSKDKHLQNMNDSNYFTYCREILFANTESFSAQRFVDMVLSQGGVQTILKKCPQQLVSDVDNFKNQMFDILLNTSIDVDFCYRMRLAIK